MTTVPACTNIAITLMGLGLSMASSGYAAHVSGTASAPSPSAVSADIPDVSAAHVNKMFSKLAKTIDFGSNLFEQEQKSRELDIMIDIRDFISETLLTNPDFKSELEKKNLKPAIPRFVIVGSQSAGKSRLLESLARQRFTYSAMNTASTRPTVIRMVPKKGQKVNEFFVGHEGPKGVEWEKKPTNESKLLELMTKWHYEDGIVRSQAGTHTRMDARPIYLRIEGEGLLDIEVVDLPGFIDEGRGPQLEMDRIETLKIAKEYVANKDNQIIIVQESADDENMKIFSSFLYKSFPELTDEAGGDTVVSDGKLDEKVKADFAKRSFLVRTKLDRYQGQLPAGKKDRTKLEQWFIGKYGGRAIDNGRKFALRLPHYERHEKKSDDFVDRLEKCDADDQSFGDEKVAKWGAKALALKGMLGIKKFSYSLQSHFKDLFDQQKGTTEKCLKEVLSSTEKKIKEKKAQVDIEKDVTMNTVALDFGTAIGKIAHMDAKGVQYPDDPSGFQDMSLYSGTSLIKDMKDFKKKSLFRDSKIYGPDSVEKFLSLEQEKMEKETSKADEEQDEKTSDAELDDAQVCDASDEAATTPAEEKNKVLDYVIDGIDKQVKVMEDAKKSLGSVQSFGKRKLAYTIAELRDYVTGQSLNLSEADYREFIANYNINILGESDDDVVNRRAAFDDFARKTLVKRLNFNMQVVGHRILRVFEDMIEPAIIWLESRQNKDESVKLANAGALVRLGERLRKNKKFREMMETKYKKYLRMLYNDFTKAASKKIDEMLMESSPIELLYASNMDILALQERNLIWTGALPEDEELVRREMKKKNVDNFFKNHEHFVEHSAPLIDRREESQKLTAASLKDVTEDIFDQAAVEMANFIETAVAKFFEAKMNNAHTSELLHTKLQTFLATAEGQEFVPKSDAAEIEKLQGEIKALELQHGKVRDHLNNLKTVRGEEEDE